MNPIFTIFLFSITMVLSDPIKYYDSRLDNLDIENIVGVKENLKKYSDCFLDQGPCDEIGAKIRKVLPESVETACLRCTPKQKHHCHRFFQELVKEYPQDVGQFQKKYDPEGKYLPGLLAAVNDF